MERDEASVLERISRIEKTLEEGIPVTAVPAQGGSAAAGQPEAKPIKKELPKAIPEDVQQAVAKVADTLGDTGRILVRESGTEPVIRVMVEAETESLCEKYVDQVIDVIKAKGHTV